MESTVFDTLAHHSVGSGLACDCCKIVFIVFIKTNFRIALCCPTAKRKSTIFVKMLNYYEIFISVMTSWYFLRDKKKLKL